MITTTTDHLEGYRITEYLGIVRHVLPEVDEEHWDSPQWEFEKYPKGTDAIIDVKLSLARSGGNHHMETAVLVGTAVKIEKIC